MKEKLKNIFKKAARSPITAVVLLSLVLFLLFFPELSLLFGATFYAPMQAVIKFLKFLRTFIIACAVPCLAFYVCFKAVPCVMSIFRQLKALRSVKRILKENKLNYNIKHSLYYAGRLAFGIKTKVRAHREDINIITVPTRRKHAKYHFADPQKIELWVKKYLAVGGKYRASVVDLSEWTQKGSIKLPKWEDGRNCLIFDRKPMEITSAEHSDFKFKISGDKIFSIFEVYTREEISKINFD